MCVRGPLATAGDMMPRSSPVVVVYVLETCAYGPHISMYIRRRRRLTRTRLLFGECILPSSSPRGQVAKAHPTSLPPPVRPSVTEPPPTEATNPSTSGYVARNNISRSEKERNNYYSLHSDIPQRHSDDCGGGGRTGQGHEYCPRTSSIRLCS